MGLERGRKGLKVDEGLPKKEDQLVPSMCGCAAYS